MTEPKFTYDGNPAESDRDAVRWHVGDTDPRRVKLDDREIDYALTNNPNVMIAASVCCEALAGKFSDQANVTVGSISKQLGSVADAYRKHAETLRRRACLGAAFSFPATTRSGKETLEQNDELPPPQMRLGIHDNPFAVQINNRLRASDWRGWAF